MIKPRTPKRGDIYLIDPNPIVGREMRDRHTFLVITPIEINKYGMVTTVPITRGGRFSREMGLTVPIIGHETNGVAVCNQIRSFDIEAREKTGNAKYIESIDKETIEEIVSRVLSMIDPA